MTMQMHQVRYFLAVATTCNFSRAAEQCNVSQPSLSRAIQSLEQEMGGALFHRERGNTHLTELGRIIYPFVEGISKQMHAARETATSYLNLDGAPLSIGVMCTIGPGMISDLIVTFRMSFPGVNLVIIERDARQLCQMMVEGRIDVAILGLPEEIEENFHVLPLFEERFVVLLPKDHQLAGKSVVMGSDLHQQAYLSRANCEFRDHIGDQFVGRGIMVRRVFSSESDDWVKAMIKAGLGFGLFPEYGTADRDLVVRPLVDPDFIRRISLLTVRGRPHSPSVGAFVSATKGFKWPGKGGLDQRPGWSDRAKAWLHLGPSPDRET